MKVNKLDYSIIKQLGENENRNFQAFCRTVDKIKVLLNCSVWRNWIAADVNVHSHVNLCSKEWLHFIYSSELWKSIVLLHSELCIRRWKDVRKNNLDYAMSFLWNAVKKISLVYWNNGLQKNETSTNLNYNMFLDPVQDNSDYL